MSTPPRILIVDDEEHVRNYVAMLVRVALGAREISKAADEAEAVAAYSAGRPDLVLLDINMVGETGFDVLRRLRQLDPQVCVVMLTSVNTRSAVESALQAGAQGYLLKDLNHEELTAELQRLAGELFGGNSPSTPSSP